MGASSILNSAASPTNFVFLTNVELSKREINMLSNGIRFIAKIVNKKSIILFVSFILLLF